MAMIDLPLAAELVLALLLVATLDVEAAPPARAADAATPNSAGTVTDAVMPPVPPSPPEWSPQRDAHARRILRLEGCAAAAAGKG
jgi:hypothetical protein